MKMESNVKSALAHLGTNSVVSISNAINITNKLLSEAIEVMFNKAFSLHINQTEVTENYYRLLQSDPNHVRLVSLNAETKKDYCDFYLKAYDIFNEILKRKPNHYFSLEFRAATKYKYAPFVDDFRELIDESLSEFEKVNEIRPSFFSYYFLGMGNPYSDFEDLSKSIELYPNFAEAYYYRGMERHDKVGKISDFSKAIELDPKNHEFYCELAIAKTGIRYNSHDVVRGSYEECLSAIEDITVAIEFAKKAKRYTGWHSLQSYYALRSKFKESIEDIPGAISDFLLSLELLDEISDYKLIKLGDLKMKNRDFQGAISEYEKVIDKIGVDKITGYKLRRIGEAKFQNNDLTEAEQIFTMLIEKEAKETITKHPSQMGSLKSAFYLRKEVRQKLDDKDGIIEDERNIKKIECNEQGLSLYSRMVYSIEDGYYDYDWFLYFPSQDKRFRGLYDQALSSFNLAIEMDPLFPLSYFNRGEMQLRFERYKNAFDDFSKVIELNENFKNVYYYIGLSKLKLKNYLGAIDDFTRVIESDWSTQMGFISDELISLDIFYYRGIARFEMNDFTGAIQDIEKALESGTRRKLEATNVLGLAKVKIGNNEE